MEKTGTKKGITLIEVIVSIGIFSIAMIGVSMLLVQAWKYNSFVLEGGEATRMASRVVHKTVGELRKIRQSDSGAYPIVSGSGFDLVVFLDVDKDGATERVRYFLDGTDFKMSVAEPTGSPPVYPTTYDREATLIHHVMNTGDQPIFSYYNRDYPADSVNNPLSTPVIASRVRMVKIHLWVNIKPNTAPDNINIESFAELRNIND